MKLNETPKALKKYVSAHRKKQKWLTAVTCLTAGVVFATTYALILPAVTLENNQTTDGTYEHVHDDSCYQEQSVLVCDKTENEGHVHDDSCYTDVRGELICGQEEGHVHEESCYSPVRGELICQEEHEHTDDCYEWTEELTCGLEENDHQHGDDCYEWTRELTCGLTEGERAHQHSDECYEKQTVLICDLPETEEDQLEESGIVPADGGEEDIALAASGELPKEILSELAEQGIYPGTVDEDGVWTAFDAAVEEDANIKAIVKLPDGTTVSADHYLYIRRVEEDEDYYPDGEVLKEAVGDSGETSGVQCYAIHWVHIYQEGDEWKYDLSTDSVLGGTNGGDDDAPAAEVQISYLKEDTYLPGSSAHRKLQVFNSRDPEGKNLEEASTPTAVTANNEAYTGFTFETNRGGPYVFVSKKLYEGYVSSIAIDSIVDGSGPFDENDDPGNDSEDSNGIIRSYDVIQYNLVVNMAARSSGVTAKTGELEFEMTLDADITEAVFDPSQMLWLNGNYTIEYLNAEGGVVLTQGADGICRDANGSAVTVNDIVSGSDQGQESYTSTIVSQRLRGTVGVQSDDNILVGNKTYGAAVQVLNAENGSKIEPTFRAWFKGNEENYGSENPLGATDVQLAERVTENEKKADEVTVSAAARFNLELAENSNVSYRNWFDFQKGQELRSAGSYTVGGKTVSGEQMYELLEALGTLEENTDKANPEEFTDRGNACESFLSGLELQDYAEVFQNIRYGRITGYGITLQVYNDATGDQNTASKGFKGVSLPQGSITFDLALETTLSGLSEADQDRVNEDQYYARLWEYNENVNEASGNQGRNMYWAYLASTRYAAWAAPYNSGGPAAANCYGGGDWQLGQVKEDGSYPFTVSGYDLNFLSTGLEFPTHRAGNGNATPGYNTYIGSFSTGYVQLLNVFPRTQAATFTLGTGVTVKNLEVTTTDGRTISADTEDTTGYAHETNKGDNSLKDSIPLYHRGGMTKANAFCNADFFDKKDADFTSKIYFLGTDFWNSGYDCSAFAGQDITLVGAARINSGDYAIRHMNILQLFDSQALSIDSDRGEPYVYSKVTEAVLGETRILYAADPDFPEGYDTNAEGMQEYISGVREEDLMYYTSLAELESAGYTCVGVLAELRGGTIYGEGGYSTALKIPMKVSQEEKFLTKTVSTVNTVRIWTNAEDMENGTVSWKDGSYDFETGKNSVPGYTPMAGSNEDHYRGEVSNDSFYEKTEYENGQVVLGSNTGGYVYGSSLLILGYKSTVDIEVDNGGDGSLATYDMDKGNYTVNYHLKDILAKVDNEAGTPQNTKTNLTVRAELDTKKEEGAKQRISAASTGYQMKASSEYMQLVSAPNESGQVLEAVDISTDPDHPTTVYYRTTENLTPPAGEEIKWTYYTIQVYAQSDTVGSQVTFEMADVTVGVSVPDITFDALLDPDHVANNDRIEASACISGTSDVRAYAATNGNMDSVTIGIIRLRGTNLVKAVDQRYIELDGVFTYTVTYANTGNTPVSVYLYDLLPDPDDIRGSRYDGINSTVTLRDVSANLSGGDEFTAEIDFYYSTLAYRDLYDNVSAFGSVDTGTGEPITDNESRRNEIQEMLNNDRLFSPLGTISGANNHQFVHDSAFDSMSTDDITAIMRRVNGIYAVVENLGGGRTLSITFTLETEGNKAGDLYRNIANSWLGDSTTPLTSNLVETTVLSRAISGVVWHDSDLDGVRDSDETLLSDVTCTLFRRNETSGQYEICTEDVTGAPVSPVITTTDGAYSFEDLAAGEYVVAFSGDALNKYTGSTLYQVNGTNDSATNDGVILSEKSGNITGKKTSYAGIDSGTYSYAIAYSLKGGQTGSLPLHTIREIVDHNLSLTNSVELYANQDLGLVYAYHELPKTGGPGTIPYIAGGLSAMGAGLLLFYKKRRKEDMASS